MSLGRLMKVIDVDSLPADPLEALRELSRADVELGTLRRQRVEAARRQGATWDQIGVSLGMSRQAAWEYYTAKAQRVLDQTAADSGLDEDEEVRIGRSLAIAARAWFLALLGQPKAAADQAGEAAATLASLSDPVAHAMAIHFQCPGLLYLTRLDEVRAATLEGSRIATSLPDEYLRSEIAGWLAFAELYLGNDEAAARLFDEIDAVLTRRGDNRLLPWIDIGRAMLASKSGRYDEAIRILDVTVQRAHKIGYRRAVQLASQQLGDVLLEGGDLEAAESAYLESLAMSEEMGSVAEMAEMLVRIAKVHVKSGRLDDAGAILASVLAHPVAEQSTLATTVSIREMATDLRADLESEAGTQVVLRRGMSANAASLAVMVKELLSGVGAGAKAAE